MVNLKIKIQALPSKLDELTRSCRLLIERDRRKAGCLDSRISRDVGDETILILEEAWENRPRLEAHFRSDHFSALIGAMKLLGEDFEIQIDADGRTEGIEAVQGARTDSPRGES